MHEMAFTLCYDEGADPFMDLFQKQSELTSNSLSTCISRDSHWLIERFVGPKPALDAVEAMRCSADGPKEEMTEATCGATRHATVLERSANSLVIYLFVERLHTCTSVYALAGRQLDKGFLIQSQRRQNRHEMRILTRSKENIEALYEQLQTSLADGISLQFGHLNGVTQWNFDSLASVSMSKEQRSTLRKAIEHGYYETPREITAAELADTLDIPQSTVSYRLQQAETQLAKGYFDQNDVTFDKKQAEMP